MVQVFTSLALFRGEGRVSERPNHHRETPTPCVPPVDYLSFQSGAHAPTFPSSGRGMNNCGQLRLNSKAERRIDLNISRECGVSR